MAKSQEKLIKIAKKMPSSSGVYFFLGRRSLGGKSGILYIGKATSLRNRVRSYLLDDIGEKRSPLIEKMVQEASDIKFEKTDSVLEATILESKLIKKFNPPFNTADKDQKSFNYVIITDEKFPRVLVVREREIEAISYELKAKFGPFTHGGELKEALKIIRKIFPFRDKCLPREAFFDPPKSRAEGVAKWGDLKPCFNFQIGLCPGVCIGAISEKEYAQTIRHIKTFFDGNKKKLIKDLEKDMRHSAKIREFEKAGEIKRKIFALKHINDIALIKNNHSEFGNSILVTRNSVFRIEAYDIAHISGSSMVGVMTVVEDGEAKKSDYRKFTIRGQRGADDTRALSEILTRRFKHTDWSLPDLIVVDGGTAQLNAAKKILESLAMKIPTVAVTKDERHKTKEVKNGGLKVESLVKKYENQILLANSEAHRFALAFHRKTRDKIIG